MLLSLPDYFRPPFPLRPIAYTSGALLVWLFCCIGTGVTLLVVKSHVARQAYVITVTTDITLWQSCTESNIGLSTCRDMPLVDNGCTASGDATRAARAFCFFSVFAAMACVGFGVVDFLSLHVHDALVGREKFVLLGAAGVLNACTLIAWAIMFGLGNTEWCGHASLKGHADASWGGGPVLLLLSWLASFGLAAASWFLRGRGDPADDGVVKPKEAGSSDAPPAEDTGAKPLLSDAALPKDVTML